MLWRKLLDPFLNVILQGLFLLGQDVSFDHRGHDSGFNAEAGHSGATQVFLSPGLSYRLLPSVQVNMRAGVLPPAEDNGVRYLKIPLNAV